MFVELMGGAGDPAQGAVEAALDGRQVGRHRQQGAAGAPRRRARGGSPRASSVALNFEAAVGRRHPDRQDAARRARRQFASRASTASSTAPATTSSRAWSRRGCRSPTACAEAQRLGYAEADPTFDIEGHDTAQKLAILASLAFGTKVDPEAVYVEGHLVDRARRPRGRRRARLPRQAARRRGEDRQGHRAARASDHGAEGIRRSRR